MVNKSVKRCNWLCFRLLYKTWIIHVLYSLSHLSIFYCFPRAEKHGKFLDNATTHAKMNRGPVEIETLLSIPPCFHSTDEINFTWYFLSSLDWREDDSESKFYLISLLPGKYQYCELFTFLLLFSHYFMLSFFSILFFYSRIGFIIFCQYNVLKVIAHQHQRFVIILNFYTTKFPVSISFI